MARNTRDGIALRWTWVFILLSLAVVLAGATLCEYAAIRVMAVANADSSSILHNPTIYVSDVRAVVAEMLVLVAGGLFVMMLGFAVFSIAVSRRTTLKVESRRLRLLEKRVRELERKNNQ